MKESVFRTIYYKKEIVYPGYIDIEFLSKQDLILGLFSKIGAQLWDLDPVKTRNVLLQN